MTPDILAIAAKWSRKYRSDLYSVGLEKQIAGAIEEATASLRAQLAEEKSERARFEQLYEHFRNRAETAQQRWIPSKERLPNEIGDYLVWIEVDSHGVHCAYWDIATMGAGDWPLNATYWKPLRTPAADSPQVAQESPLNGKEGK